MTSSNDVVGDVSDCAADLRTTQTVSCEYLLSDVIYLSSWLTDKTPHGEESMGSDPNHDQIGQWDFYKSIWKTYEVADTRSPIQQIVVVSCLSRIENIVLNLIDSKCISHSSCSKAETYAGLDRVGDVSGESLWHMTWVYARRDRPIEGQTDTRPMFYAYCGMCCVVVRALDLRLNGRGFDSRPCVFK